MRELWGGRKLRPGFDVRSGLEGKSSEVCVAKLNLPACICTGCVCVCVLREADHEFVTETWS